MSLYRHVLHDQVHRRKEQGPVKVADQRPQGSGFARFNARFGLAITAAVGSMQCAYLFGALALVSLPAAILSGSVIVIVAWIAQTFLQLVLLSVILTGQNLSSAAADKRAEQTFLDTEALLQGQAGQVAHLAAQDEKIITIEGLLDVHTAGGLADVVAAIADVHNMVTALTLRERRR